MTSWLQALNLKLKLGWVVGIGLVCLVLGLILGGAFSGETSTTALSTADRSAWLQMASDSYAVNGDVELTRQRLSRLVDTDNTWKQVAVWVEQEAAARQNVGDAQGAQRLQQMSDALNLPGVGVPVEETSAIRKVELWRILLFIGAVLAFLALVAGFLWFMARQTLKRQGAADNPESAQEDEAAPAQTEQETEQPLELAPSHALSGAAAEKYAAGRPFQPVEEINSEPQRMMPTPKFQAPKPQLESSADIIQESEPEAMVEVQNGSLGTFEAEYTFGTDDFDCSFTITTPEGVFMGDCGVGVSDILPAIGPQHVDALEVWLFDKGDVSSVSKFLVSEYAYENPVLNNRLSAKGDLVLAEPGAVITLETRSLRVTAQVLAAEYDASADPNKSYFNRLLLELTAEIAD